MKNAGFAFFLGAIVVFPGEVFSSLERLRTFLAVIARKVTLLPEILIYISVF